MRSIGLVSRAVIAVCVILLAPFFTSAAFAQGDAVLLDNMYFDWLDIVEEMALFEWSVDVRNNTDQPVRLRVILDVLDDDDRAVNRDDQGNPNDSVIVTVEPGQTVPVEQQGAMGYDRAAEVVTYRQRWEIIRTRR